VATALVPHALAVIDATPRTLRALLADLPDAVVNAPGAEGWSARDVVAHLTSVHRPAFAERLRVMVEQDDPLLPNVDEEAELRSSGYRARPVVQLIDELTAMRAEESAWVRTLSADQLLRTGRHEIAGRLLVSEIIHHEAWHDLLHIRQVCGLLAAPLDAARGAMASSFPDASQQ
jgi:hypothetical protein